MKNIKLSTTFGKFSLIALILVICSSIYLISCKKVDETISDAVNFEGVFSSSDGHEITLTESDHSGKFTKLGLPRSTFANNWVGHSIMYGMSRISDNKWEGKVLDNKFEYIVDGTATIKNDELTITPSTSSSYIFNRASATAPGTSGGDTLINQNVTGDVNEKQIIRFNVSSGVKKLEIRTVETATSYWNTADMFVKKGSDPSVTLAPYKWDADCAGTENNRSPEYCSFSNPSSGQWSVLLFGYNSHFSSQLIVTVTK